MIVDRFLKDYRCEIRTEADGKTREVYVYDGRLYISKETAREHRIRGIFIGTGAILAAGTFVLGILFDSIPARCVYAVLPYAVNFLTFYFLFRSVVAYLKKRDSYTKKQKMVSFDSFRPVGVVGALLDLTALVGAGVCFIKGARFEFNDFLFVACAAVQMGFFVFVFITGKKICSQITENTREERNND